MAELPFKVETWSADGARLEETLASATIFSIARAAYDAALAARPSAWVTLRHGARLLAERPRATGDRR